MPRKSLTPMVFALATVAVLLAGATAAWSGPHEDCANSNLDVDVKLNACNTAINSGGATANTYYNRGISHRAKGDIDRAIADYNKAIEINPKFASAYSNRGVAYRAKGDTDRAIADYTTAIQLDPKHAPAYNNRAWAYFVAGKATQGLPDVEMSLKLRPNFTNALHTRAQIFEALGRNEEAIADYKRAISVDAKTSVPRLALGRLYARNGDQDRGLVELTSAISLDPKDPELYTERAAIYEARGLKDLAKTDYMAALAQPAISDTKKQAHATAQSSLVRLEVAARPPQPIASGPPAAAAPLGRRVALVIGNANYAHAERLTNPMNDARAVAASLRRLGFADVIERYDLNLVALSEVIKAFGDKAADADWAVVYFAGHGIEIGGTTYLLPTDAKLARDTHVQDEALALDRLLSKVETAKRLRLVILDSCRNNPFVPKMARTVAGRSIGRGLPRIEPEGGVLVAYAAKHGTIASDGRGVNSPFAEALLVHLEEPGLELQFLFRKVRDRVLETTQKAQEPFLYGSLSSEGLYFKQ